MSREMDRTGHSGEGREIARASRREASGAIGLAARRAATRSGLGPGSRKRPDVSCPPRSGIRFAIRIGTGIFALLYLLAAAMGCSIGSPELEEAVPTSTPVPTATRTATPTWPPTWTPTPAPTATPTETPVPTPNPTERARGAVSRPRSTRQVTNLDFEFWVTDKDCIPGPGYAITFFIRGKGGDGVYTYYRDIDQIGGPMEGGLTYEYEWLECGGAVGTFYVRSAGQEVAKKFWVYPPSCCE